jgi:hypothetical protein
MGQPLFNPLDGRRLEHLVATTSKAVPFSFRVSTFCSVSRSACAMARPPRPSPMTSTEFASRRFSAESSASLSRMLSGTCA